MKNFEEMLKAHNFKLDDKKKIEAFVEIVGGHWAIEEKIEEYKNMYGGIILDDGEEFKMSEMKQI